MLDKKSFFDRIKRDREEAGNRLMESTDPQDLVPELDTVPDLQAALGQTKNPPVDVEAAKESKTERDAESVGEVTEANASPADVHSETQVAPPEDVERKPEETFRVKTDASSVEAARATKEESHDEEPQAAPLDPIALSMLDQIVGTYENTPIQSVPEIYRSAEMEQDEKKSVFIADRFLNALPSELEESVKRETVLNIIRISGIEIDALLRDAKQRVDVLDAVLNVTNLETQNRDRRDLGLIIELEKRIRDLIEIRNARKTFRTEQNQIVEEERDKLQRIIRFLQPNQF